MPPEFCYDIPRLLQFFESLGDNCDFGVAQRAVGIEPLGLFRFAACKADDMATLLRTRFQDLGGPEDLWVDVVGPTREYWLKSRRFSFETHTERYASRDAEEPVRSAAVERTRYLKRRLVGDLSRGWRLCVWRGAADVTVIREIATALRSYAPSNCLLWVTLTDGRAAPGSVERDSHGVFRGFLSRFGDYEGRPHLPVEEWVALCAAAYRLWRNEDPPKVRLENLITHSVAQRSCAWSGDPAVATRELAELSAIGGTVIEHRVAKSGTTPICGVTLPIACGGTFAFSVWVRIPEEFRGGDIYLLLAGFDTIAHWPADPKSYARWQRIWVAASLPQDARLIACWIMAEAAEGDVFLSTAWCLERANNPSGHGFVV